MHPLGQPVFLLVTSIPVLKPCQLLLGVLIDGAGSTGSQACSNKGKQKAGPVKRRWSQGEAGRGGADDQGCEFDFGQPGQNSRQIIYTELHLFPLLLFFHLFPQNYGALNY